MTQLECNAAERQTAVGNILCRQRSFDTATLVERNSFRFAFPPQN